MHVGLDGRSLNTRQLRGMGKMLFNLLAEARATPDVRFTVFANDPALPLQLPENLNGKSVVWDPPGFRFRRWEQLSLPLAAQRAGCALLHCPGTWCPWWQPLPTVVTVHDVIAWTRDPGRFFVHQLAPAAYRKCARLITVSHSSKDDIAAKWPELADKVTVIGHGTSAEYLTEGFEPPAPAVFEHAVPARYVLYFGGSIPRKRLDWAIKVWAGLDRDGLGLVACGLGRSEQAKWRAQIPAHRRDLFWCPDFVSERELANLYAHAELVLYPTLDEGFGLPALEAQAVGAPVLMSAVGGLRELTGPGAVVLPPQDLDAWVHAAAAHLGDRSARAAAREWAAAWTWRRAWSQTLEVYERAVRGTRADAPRKDRD